jgi:hypothetical protein
VIVSQFYNPEYPVPNVTYLISLSTSTHSGTLVRFG